LSRGFEITATGSEFSSVSRTFKKSEHPALFKKDLG
jgi:hypothetical protein